MEEFKPTRHDDVMDADIYEHPTFGVISFARGQTTHCPLFGSSVEHQNVISVEIKTAELHRSLSRDWIHGDKIIVRAIMSPTQFADAITGLNCSEIPITLDYVKGIGAIKEEVPFQNKIAQFNQEFGDTIDTLSKRFDDTIKMAEETHAQKRLIKEIELLKQHFKSNIPFVNKQFSTQMEHTVKEAKGEVEAFISAKITQYGLEAIKNQAPRLTQGDDKIKQITER